MRLCNILWLSVCCQWRARMSHLRSSTRRRRFYLCRSVPIECRIVWIWEEWRLHLGRDPASHGKPKWKPQLWTWWTSPALVVPNDLRAFWFAGFEFPRQPHGRLRKASGVRPLNLNWNKLTASSSLVEIAFASEILLSLSWIPHPSYFVIFRILKPSMQ